MARLVYIDEDTGKRRDRQRWAVSYADAKELAEQLAKEFDQSAGRSIDAEKLTFAELADYCEKHYYKAAEYHDERKVAARVSAFAEAAFVGRVCFASFRCPFKTRFGARGGVL